MKLIIDTTTKTITVNKSFTLKELEYELKSIFKDDISNYQIIIEPITLTVDRYIIKESNPFNTPYSPNPYIRKYDVLFNTSTIPEEWKKDYFKNEVLIKSDVGNKMTPDIEKPKNPMI